MPPAATSFGVANGSLSPPLLGANAASRAPQSPQETMAAGAAAAGEAPAPITRGQRPLHSQHAAASATNHRQQPRRCSNGTSTRRRRRESPIEGPRHEAGAASVSPEWRWSEEPVQAAAAAGTFVAVENFSNVEGPDHRSPGPFDPAGGGGHTAVDTVDERWDSPDQSTEGETQTSPQEPPWDRPEEIKFVEDFLALEPDMQRFTQQATAAAGPDPTAAAAAAAENRPARRTPLRNQGACEWAAGGVAVGGAGTQRRPLQGAATSGSARWQAQRVGVVSHRQQQQQQQQGTRFPVANAPGVAAPPSMPLGTDASPPRAPSDGVVTLQPRQPPQHRHQHQHQQSHTHHVAVTAPLAWPPVQAPLQQQQLSLECFATPLGFQGGVAAHGATWRQQQQQQQQQQQRQRWQHQHQHQHQQGGVSSPQFFANLPYQPVFGVREHMWQPRPQQASLRFFPRPSPGGWQQQQQWPQHHHAVALGWAISAPGPPPPWQQQHFMHQPPPPPAVGGGLTFAQPLRECDLNAPGARSTRPGGIAEIQAGACEMRVEVQTGGAETVLTSPSEDGVLAWSGGSDESCGSETAEGALDSMDEDAAAAAAAAAVTIEGSAVGEEGEGGAVIGGAAADAIEQPLNLVNGEHTVVLIDLETTGLKATIHRVIQVAAKVMGSQDPNHVFEALVDPEGAYITPKIQGLTRITPKRLADSGAQPFREVWVKLVSWLETILVAARSSGGGGGGGVVLVAHNANFDRRFLEHELARMGLDSSVLSSAGVSGFVDTLALLRNYAMWRQPREPSCVPARPRSFALGALFKHLCGQDMPRAHTALGDVEGLEFVLSSPGIKERWRRVASSDRACQTTTAAPVCLEEEGRAKRARPVGLY